MDALNPDFLFKCKQLSLTGSYVLILEFVLFLKIKDFLIKKN